MFENKHADMATSLMNLALKITDKKEHEIIAARKAGGDHGVLKLISENCTCVTREEMQAAIAKAIAEHAAGNN